MTRTCIQTIKITHIVNGDNQQDINVCCDSITLHAIEVLIRDMKLNLKTADIGSTFHIEEAKP
jgi:hypothetical protein